MRLIRSLIAVMLAAFGCAAAADTYPSRPVKIVVPFSAGGPADVYARFVAERLQGALGQAFVIENRPGGGSVIGTDIVAKSAPDGYTLLLMSNTHTVNESLMPGKPFVLMRDFTAVAPINYSDLVLVVNPAVPAKTLAELIALAKAQPGKLNYASSGPGTPYHMAGELFKAMAGLDIVHVPYKESSGARTGVLGGQVDGAMTYASFAINNKGRIRPLAVAMEKRHPLMPDVPTFKELGVDWVDGAYRGIGVAKSTSPEARKRLSDLWLALNTDPEMKKLADQSGFELVNVGVDQMDAFMRDKIRVYTQTAQQMGLGKK